MTYKCGLSAAVPVFVFFFTEPFTSVIGVKLDVHSVQYSLVIPLSVLVWLN